jgi:para-aminobenzoate synthetase component 1
LTVTLDPTGGAGGSGIPEAMELSLEIIELADDREAVDLFGEVSHLPYSCFLDSSLRMPGYGRRSFIAFDPYLVLTTRGYRATYTSRTGATTRLEADPFAALSRAVYARSLDGAEGLDGMPPFLGGGVGFLSYELGRYVERLPASVEDDLGLPELAFCFFDRVIAVDHETGRKVLAVSYPRGEHPGRAVDESLARIERGVRGGAYGGPRPGEGDAELSFRSGFTKDEYLEGVRRVKEYILAGDIYQANLSQRFDAPLLEPSWRLYRRLRTVNAAPFSAYLNFGDFAVASSSPERFLKVQGRRVETRPIKGTRPRFRDPAEDEKSKRLLLSSAKDRAELSMIVDLERNDLGRVCDYGSVRVTEHAVLESYATVHHLVSTVVGDIHEGRGVVDLLRATFPGGSITGAPKIRSMEIIDEIEPTARSVYTGGIGYLGFNGRHDMNVAIRTMILRGGRVYFQVGGGIVADSEPEAEYQETLDKGKAMFDAITGVGS